MTKELFKNWCDSHSITEHDISKVCCVTVNTAKQWLNPRRKSYIPLLHLNVLWNHFELDIKLQEHAIK